MRGNIIFILGVAVGALFGAVGVLFYWLDFKRSDSAQLDENNILMQL